MYYCKKINMYISVSLSSLSLPDLLIWWIKSCTVQHARPISYCRRTVRRYSLQLDVNHGVVRITRCTATVIGAISRLQTQLQFRHLINSDRIHSTDFSLYHTAVNCSFDPSHRTDNTWTPSMADGACMDTYIIVYRAPWCMGDRASSAWCNAVLTRG